MKYFIFLIYFVCGMYPLITHANSYNQTNSPSQNEDKTAIHQAIISGQTFKAISLINRTNDIDFKDENGWTPLMYAARLGNTTVAHKLLKKGANIESANHAGMTPLLWASYAGHKKMVEFLIKNGANLKQTNSSGETAYNLAVAMGHTELANLIKPKIKQKNSVSPIDIDALIEQKDPTITLSSAITNNDLEKVLQLIDKYPNMDLNKEVIHHWTPLMYATISGYDQLVDVLVKNPRVDINKKGGEFNTTALILALSHKQYSCAKILLSHEQIDVHHIDDYKRSALLLGLKSENEEIKNLFSKYQSEQKEE